MGKRIRPDNWLDKNFQFLEAAAIAGERCPQNNPHGPIHSGAITELVKANRIRSEVYSRNYRVVTLLVGPHRGKSTAPAPPGSEPYIINGLHVKRFRDRTTIGKAAAAR